VLLGIWLYLGFGIGLGPGNGWMHAKLVLVVAALGYHYSCGVVLRQFEQGTNRRSHIFYRWFNEAPVLILTAATALVVIKPF
jgi:putative membrane protein